MAAWKATVVYDAHGTKTKILTGHRVSSQLTPGTETCLIEIFDSSDSKVAAFQASKTYEITLEYMP